jgi:hypothetical protein
MSEWFKEHAWKVCIRQNCIRGSNPRLSATKKIPDSASRRGFFLWCSLDILKQMPLYLSFVKNNTINMYKILFFLALTLPGSLIAQTKPGKFEIINGLFEKKYLVDNQKMTRFAADNHLQAHDMGAAEYFYTAKQFDNSFYFFSLLSIIGACVGSTSNDPDLRMAGNRVAVGAAATSIVCVLVANNNEKKAKKHYNLKFGYQ